MKHLITGLLSSLIIILVSCKENVDTSLYTKYVYINSSEYDIFIEAFKNGASNFSDIKKNDTLLQEAELMFGSIADIIVYSDSVNINFENKKVNKFTPDVNSKFNINNLLNYTKKIISESNIEYHYIFTEEDYENAVLIE